MQKRLHGASVSALALLAVAGISRGAPPPYTATALATSGNTITGIGQISNTLDATLFAGPGCRSAAVTGTGQWLLNLDTRYHHGIGSSTHEALVRTQSPGGPFAPYVAQGTTGFLTVPAAGAVATAFHAVAMNETGNAALAFGWAPDDTSPQDGTALGFNTNKIILQGGDPATALGFAPGTVWNALSSDTSLVLNDNHQLLVSSTVTENAAVRRALVRFQLDAAGNVLGQTLLAKEDGPVAGGGGTWTSISPGMGATRVAMNNSGAVLFSGTTSAGIDGVYSSGSAAFVAQAGGPAPVANESWGSLAGAPLDINNAGVAVFRGITSSSTGSYSESVPDAGERPDFEDHTFGNGPLNLISGTLASDHDVDWFRVVVTDPGVFSATTVPDPGSGFGGASFDTVLTLIGDPGENGNIPGATPGGRTRNDDASASVVQSTITGGGGRTRVGGSYFLAISTPKSRAGKTTRFLSTNTYPVVDAWSMDPSGIAVAGGLVYWPDPSAGALRRATTSGALQSDVPWSGASPHFAVDSAGGKIYWADRSQGRIRRANLDGSSPEDLVTGFPSLDNPVPGGSPCTGLTLDLARGKVYWTKASLGEVNRCNLDGTGAERVLQDEIVFGNAIPGPDPTGTLSPWSVAVDTSAGSANKVYWANSFNNRIERCNLDGTGRQTLLIGAGAAGLVIDSAAGKLYWTNTAAGRIERANLDGSALETVALSSLPHALAIDTAGGFVYWTNILERVVRRAGMAGAVPAPAADLLSVGPDTGERAPDGPGTAYTGFIDAWTRQGPAEAVGLPYHIKLTGATFQYSKTLLAKVGPTAQKVAAVGDAVPGVASSFLSEVAGGTSAVRISDRGDVLWAGTYYPVTGNNHPPMGVFYNQDLLFTESTVINGDRKPVFLLAGPTMEMSANGVYAVVGLNMNHSPFSFNQFDNELLIQFTLPDLAGACCNATTCTVVAQASCTGTFKGAGTTCLAPGNPTTCCPANFDGLSGVTVSDIFSFLTAWFEGNPAANFDGVGGVAVPDIFAFLTAWFAGCA